MIDVKIAPSVHLLLKLCLWMSMPLEVFHSLFVVLSLLFSACKLILLVLCHCTTLPKDVRVYGIRNTKGEDKTEVNGNLEFAFFNNILYIDITYST